MKLLNNKRLWLYLFILTIATGSLFWEAPSMAAPHRTVPKFTPQPTHTPTPVPVATVAPAISQVIMENSDTEPEPGSESESESETPQLALTIEQSPRFAQQGETVELQFTITNQSRETATNIFLRDSFPPDLKIIACITQGTIDLCQPDTTDLQIRWPQLLPSQILTANVQLHISNSLSDGVVLENLAAVYAQQMSGQTVGYRLGMPPVLVPYFD